MDGRENEDVRRRLSEDPGCSENNGKLPSNQEDRLYAGIRGHESYILFHFFTLFGVCFLIGVAIIHLSLCMNANTAPVSIFSMVLNEKGKTQENTESYSELYSEEKPLWHAFENPFLLAPSHAENVTANVTGVFAKLL
ncbi:uncharacterized protein LOC100186744 [Ciona intestinalis]